MIIFLVLMFLFIYVCICMSLSFCPERLKIIDYQNKIIDERKSYAFKEEKEEIVCPSPLFLECKEKEGKYPHLVFKI